MVGVLCLEDSVNLLPDREGDRKPATMPAIRTARDQQ